jgi:hypothetical protein
VPEVKLVSSLDGPDGAPVLVPGNPIGTTRDVWAHQPRWFTPEFVPGSPAEVETVLGMLRGTSPVGYAGCAEAIAAEASRHPERARPTLAASAPPPASRTAGVSPPSGPPTW